MTLLVVRSESIAPNFVSLNVWVSVSASLVIVLDY